MSEAPRRPTLLLCLATVWLVWGSSYLFTRIGVMHLPPLLFGGIRFTIAGVLLLGFARWRGSEFSEIRRNWPHLLVLSLVGIALVNGLQVWSMQFVSSQGGALLNASCAFWIVLFGLFGRRSHRPGALALAGILIGFIGTALLVWPTGDAGGVTTPLVPQLTILCACVAFSAATIHLRNLDLRLNLFALSGVQMLCGGVVLTVAGLAAGEAERFTASPAGLAAMAWQTVMSSCFAYTAYYWLAQNASPAQTGTYAYVNPLIATALGFLVLGERMSSLQLVASGIVVAGVVLVSWPTSISMKRAPRVT